MGLIGSLFDGIICVMAYVVFIIPMILLFSLPFIAIGVGALWLIILLIKALLLAI